MPFPVEAVIRRDASHRLPRTALGRRHESAANRSPVTDMAKITIVVILTYLGGVIFAIANGPHWAFYLYQVVYFLNPENRWWSIQIPSFAYSKVSVLLLFASFLFYYRRFTANRWLKNPQFKWTILLLGIYCLTYLWAFAPHEHLPAMIDFIKMIIVLTVAYKVLDSQQKIEWSLLVYIIGCAYIGYEAYVNGRDQFGRVEGIGLIDAPDSNGVSAAMVASLPLIIYFLWWGDRKIKIAMLLAAPLIVNGFILINSRGAFLGCVAGVGAFLWIMMFSRLKSPKQKRVAIGIAVAGFAGALSLVDATFIERMMTLTEVEDEMASGSHRYRMWVATFDLVRDYPLGVGARGYELLSAVYLPSFLFFDGSNYKSVHSIWFQALSEAGWLGFFVFIGLILSSFRSLRSVIRLARERGQTRTYYLAQALYCGFLGLLVTSSFINQFRVQLIYWCILFCSCLYSVVVVNQPATEEAAEHYAGYVGSK